jgi:hypothetical protein
MKTIKSLLFLMASFAFLLACTEKDELLKNENSGAEIKSSRHGMNNPKTVTIPFKADFIGNYVSVDVSTICGDYPWMRVINEGEGTGTHLGKFTHHMDFCCEIEQGFYPGDYMNAYFVAANGDTLFVACAGQVINGRAQDQPEYVTSYFRDPFVILGGTGRFKGATGNGMTDDYNSSVDAYSHHHWTGRITLLKGENHDLNFSHGKIKPL